MNAEVANFLMISPPEVPPNLPVPKCYHSRFEKRRIERDRWRDVRASKRLADMGALGSAPPFRPSLRSTASNRRMSRYRATLLKTAKHLNVRSDCFRTKGQTRPAAPPQGGSEPFLPDAARCTNWQNADFAVILGGAAFLAVAILQWSMRTRTGRSRRRTPRLGQGTFRTLALAPKPSRSAHCGHCSAGINAAAQPVISVIRSA
jgi:hypothetical protein